MRSENKTNAKHHSMFLHRGGQLTIFCFCRLWLQYWARNCLAVQHLYLMYRCESLCWQFQLRSEGDVFSTFSKKRGLCYYTVWSSMYSFVSPYLQNLSVLHSWGLSELVVKYVILITFFLINAFQNTSMRYKPRFHSGNQLEHAQWYAAFI